MAGRQHAALNQFAGLSIADSTPPIPSRKEGTNLLGNITLPNPTVLSFEVGTLNLDIMSGELVIGNATMTDVTLMPGDNTFPLTGTLDLKSVNIGEEFHPSYLRFEAKLWDAVDSW